MTYTLYYFDVRGRAEPIRLLFHYGNIPFNDVRIQRQEWRVKKQSFPFGQLPVLEIDGQIQLAQSYAIARFVATKIGLAGKNDIESAQIDSVADLYKEFIEASAPYLHRKPNTDKEELRKTIFEPSVQRYLPLFEKLLEKNGSGFFTSSLSWADLFFAEGMLSLQNVEPDYHKQHPILIAHQNRVHSVSQLKSYVDQRAHSDF